MKKPPATPIPSSTEPLVQRALIYTRVSTTEQGDGYSLPTQLESCRAYAVQKGYLVGDDDCYSDLHTGTELERPGLDALLAHLRRERIHVVIVHAIDRLSRVPGNQAILELEFAQVGTRIEYVIGQYANTPEGELSRLIASAIAQFENRQRVERGRRGKRGKLQAGYVLASRRGGPFGYDYISEPHKGHLVINEAEAAVVREIFAWTLAGTSSYAIARMLSERGVLTSGDYLKKGTKVAKPGAWAPTSVRVILHNPAYRGEWVYGRKRKVKRQGKIYYEPAPPEAQIAVPIPAIVDEATWYAVQEQMARNKQAAPRNAKREYLLRGLIRCTCGLTWRGLYKTNCQLGYYCCEAKQNYKWLHSCPMPYVRGEQLEEAVWAAVERTLFDPQVLRAELAHQRERAHTDLDAQRSRLAAVEAAQAEAKRKLALLLDQALAMGFLPELIEDRKCLLLDQLRDLDADAALLRPALEAATLSPLQEEIVLAFAAKVRAGMQALTFADKRRVLELLQVRIDVIGPGQFRVTAFLPISDQPIVVPREPRRRRRKKQGALADTAAPQTGHQPPPDAASDESIVNTLWP